MRIRKRWWMIALAVVVLVSGAVTLTGVFHERRTTFTQAAERYREYARNYGPPNEKFGTMWTSCYGSLWDGYTESVIYDRMNHATDQAYLANRADHYQALARKYERAAARPWRSITLDPPLAGSR